MLLKDLYAGFIIKITDSERYFIMSFLLMSVFTDKIPILAVKDHKIPH